MSDFIDSDQQIHCPLVSTMGIALMGYAATVNKTLISHKN